MTQAASASPPASKNRKPDKTFRTGTIEAAIWREEVVVDKRTVVRFSIRVQKRYRDKGKDEWKNTDYFFADDLSRLALVAQRAFEYVTMNESDAADTGAAA
jgi:hypothetical protein